MASDASGRKEQNLSRVVYELLYIVSHHLHYEVSNLDIYITSTIRRNGDFYILEVKTSTVHGLLNVPELKPGEDVSRRG